MAGRVRRRAGWRWADAYKQNARDLARTADALAEAVRKPRHSPERARSLTEHVDAQINSITQLFVFATELRAIAEISACSAIDLVLERYCQGNGEKHLLAMRETTLEKMAKGGVSTNWAGGFHRYSGTNTGLVPHFEKMSYDNSELLKNYLHGWQGGAQSYFCASGGEHHRVVNEVLSDREQGGF